MSIELNKLIPLHKLNIKGVIHAGAHYGEEYQTYKNAGIKEVIFIEPCKEAFKILRSNTNNEPILFNCAVGSKNEIAEIYSEQANEGMSNSLLKPAKHLTQYPNIKFISKETVQIRRLDSLEFDRSKYNLLYMDIQGYELEALKGAIETLAHIDYIYSEVNREELYEGCAKVEELDNFLESYTRVFTDWMGGTWGDALYIKK